MAGGNLKDYDTAIADAGKSACGGWQYGYANLTRLPRPPVADAQ